MIKVSRKEVRFHFAVGFIWFLMLILLLLNKDHVSWVFGAIALTYLALEEWLNALWFHRSLRTAKDSVWSAGEEKPEES